MATATVLVVLMVASALLMPALAGLALLIIGLCTGWASRRQAAAEATRPSGAPSTQLRRPAAGPSRGESRTVGEYVAGLRRGSWPERACAQYRLAHQMPARRPARMTPSPGHPAPGRPAPGRVPAPRRVAERSASTRPVGQ